MSEKVFFSLVVCLGRMRFLMSNTKSAPLITAIIMNGALKINRAGLDFGLLILVLCVLSNFSCGFETLDPNYTIPGVNYYYQNF